MSFSLQLLLERKEDGHYLFAVFDGRCPRCGAILKVRIGGLCVEKDMPDSTLDWVLQRISEDAELVRRICPRCGELLSIVTTSQEELFSSLRSKVSPQGISMVIRDYSSCSHRALF
ncbi:MAG: hypothetical protein KBC26_00115 [Candidatus Pacebacteria bacterium]|nr:hypothetical protein [Candidatus Paceibacterota bacterium]